MAWLFCILDRPWLKTSCPVVITNPPTHPKNKAWPAQYPFFYESSITFEEKLKVQRDSKISSSWLVALLKTEDKTAVSGPIKRLVNSSLMGLLVAYAISTVAHKGCPQQQKKYSD